jgi:hypothetical protein
MVVVQAKAKTAPIGAMEVPMSDLLEMVGVSLPLVVWLLFAYLAAVTVAATVGLGAVLAVKVAAERKRELARRQEVLRSARAMPETHSPGLVNSIVAKEIA